MGAAGTHDISPNNVSGTSNEYRTFPIASSGLHLTRTGAPDWRSPGHSGTLAASQPSLKVPVPPGSQGRSDAAGNRLAEALTSVYPYGTERVSAAARSRRLSVARVRSAGRRCGALP